MEPLAAAQIKQLMAPLNPTRVASRKQGGATLSYLEAWDVRATLIRIFGFGGWSAEVIESKILRMEQEVPAWEWNKNRDAPKVQKKNSDGSPQFNWQVVAQSTMRLHIPLLDATYTETAIASQVGPDPGEVADFSQKTSSSDALKRAAMNLGTQFGLSLYNDGDTSDVVRVLLEPTQALKLKEAREAVRQDQTPRVAVTEVAQIAAQVPMVLDIDEPDPAAMASAKSSVREAFGG